MNEIKKNFKDNCVSIILPTLNEVGHIKNLIKDIKNQLSNYQSEIIVVDDSSTDGTIDVLRELEQEKLIKFFVRTEENCLTKSLQQGIDNSRYDTLCWLDADYSHHPKYLKQIINSVINNNYDIAVNVRKFVIRKDYKILQGSLSFILNMSLRFILKFNFHDYTSGFVCIKKEIFNNYSLKGDYGEYFIDLIYFCIKNNYKIEQLNYKEFPRASGHSKTGQNIFDFFKRGRKYISTAIEAFIKY